MAIVVDTCSLVMIAKNYLPLDKDGCLLTFLEDAFYKRELITAGDGHNKAICV